MIFFSIIIPVYNGELYLRRCLESILRQSFQNYEIVIVDDASEDHSPEICIELSQFCDKIVYERVIHRGASAARNYGIGKARGKYLVFVDADDFIEKDMLSELYKTLSLPDEPDMCYMNCHYVITNGNCVMNTVFRWEHLFGQTTSLSVNEFLDIVTKDGNCVPGSSWLMICNTEFIKKHHILFDEMAAWSEDSDFSYQALRVAKKVKCCGFCGYYYYMDNEQSVSKDFVASKVIGRMSLYYKWAYYFMNDKEVKKNLSIETRERLVQQLLVEYCQILNLYGEIPDRQGQREIKQKLYEERNIWKLCRDRRFRDYVKYGVSLGTLIQKIKRIMKHCLEILQR